MLKFLKNWSLLKTETHKPVLTYSPEVALVIFKAICRECGEEHELEVRPEINPEFFDPVLFAEEALDNHDWSQGYCPRCQSKVFDGNSPPYDARLHEGFY